MDKYVQFKKENGPAYQEKLRMQFYNGIDARLRGACFDTGWFLYSRYRKPMIITQLIRTVEENKAVGGSQYSAHLDARAVDWRTWTLTEGEIDAVLGYLDSNYGEYLYIKRHDSGRGDHVHTNIPYKYRLVA